MLPRVAEALRLLRRWGVVAETYVDLGCGEGGITVEVSRVAGAKRVYCVDVDDRVLARARERGLAVYRLDLSADKLPFDDETADLITSFEVIEHLINPDNMLREAHRVLRRGATCSSLHPTSPTG